MRGLLRRLLETAAGGHAPDREHERLTALREELDEVTIRRVEALEPEPGRRCLETCDLGPATTAAWGRRPRAGSR